MTTRKNLTTTLRVAVLTAVTTLALPAIAVAQSAALQKKPAATGTPPVAPSAQLAKPVSAGPRPLGVAPADGMAPGAEYRRLYASGRVRDEAVKLGAGFRQVDYYEDGGTKRELEWSGGKLNGIARLYLPDRQLWREIRFRDNRVLEFTEYRQGRVYTHIAADRRTFVNRGVRFAPRWDKYYERLPNRRLAGYTREALTDWMLLFKKPEEVTQALSDLSGFFDQRTGNLVSDANDIVSCGSGKAGLASDANLSQSTLQTAARSARGGSAGASGSGRAAMVQVHTAVSNLAGPCGGQGGKGTASRGANLGGVGARAGQVAQAEQALDQAASACRASGRTGSDMFAIGPGAGFIVADLLQIAAAVGEVALLSSESVVTTATAVGAESLVVEATVIDGLAVSAATESAAGTAAATAARGFVSGALLEGAAAANAVAAAAVVGWAVGTLINDSAVGQALTNQIAQWQEANDAAYQQAAEQAQRQQDSTGNQTGTPGAGRPDPESQGRNRCDYFESFKNHCKSTGWNTRQCAAFAGMVSGCKGDVTRIQVAGNDGDVFSVGCPVSKCRSGGSQPAGAVACPADDAESLRQHCERQGLIAQPGPGGSLQCGPRGLTPGDLPPAGPDPNRINPDRG